MTISERKQAVRLVKLIANARPESARLLFNKYGIDAPVSERNLLSAIVAHGKPFIRDLATELATIKFTGPAADGDGTEETTGTFWSTDWEGISNSLGGLFDFINSAGSAFTGLWNNLSGKTQDTADEYAQMQYELELRNMETQKQLAQQRTIIIVVAAVVVVALIAFFAMKK